MFRHHNKKILKEMGFKKKTSPNYDGTYSMWGNVLTFNKEGFEYFIDHNFKISPDIINSLYDVDNRKDLNYSIKGKVLDIDEECKFYCTLPLEDRLGYEVNFFYYSNRILKEVSDKPIESLLNNFEDLIIRKS